MLSDVLRLEVAPLGLDVIEIQPGGVESNIAEVGGRGLDRYAQPTSRYRAMADAIAKRARLSQAGAMTAETFASEVVPAILRSRAPRVIRSGRGAQFATRIARLPVAMRDRMLAKKFGLEALAKGLVSGQVQAPLGHNAAAAPDAHDVALPVDCAPAERVAPGG